MTTDTAHVPAPPAAVDAEARLIAAVAAIVPGWSVSHVQAVAREWLAAGYSVAEAVLALRHGYITPSAAMDAGIIARRDGRGGRGEFNTTEGDHDHDPT
jgi:hypothetical protein